MTWSSSVDAPSPPSDLETPPDETSSYDASRREAHDAMIQGPLSEMLLDGRYRVGELIGSGGFGHVYVAIHVGLEGKVAIKVPRIDDVPGDAVPEAIGNFLEEGRMLKRLRHPNLAAALDVAVLPPDADQIALPYLVLEWCDGPTLKEWRAMRPGPMPATEAWFLLKPVFEAIAYAHAEGIAHRDLKPANIIMEELRDGSIAPRVIDFGIAKIVSVVDTPSSGNTRTTSARRAFTPRYAAPEQLTGMRTGPRTDVYALALVLLETIMGRPVFASDSDSRRAVMEANPPTPRKLGLDLEGWNEIFERALALKATDRYADAGAFLRALEGAPEAPAEMPPLPTGEPGSSPPPEGGASPFAGIPSARPSSNVTHPIVPMTGRSAAESASRDETDSPASRTLRADTESASSSRETRRGVGPIVAAIGVAAGLATAAIWWSGQRLDAPAPATPPGSVAVASSAPAAPPDSVAKPSGPSRPLRALTGTELVERATKAGLAGCNVSRETAEGVEILCGESSLTLGSDDTRRPPGGLRAVMQAKAIQASTGDKKARFTTQGMWSFLLVVPAADADRMAAEILTGISHEGIGTEVPPETPIPAPSR